MSDTPITIVCVNLRRGPDLLHAFLRSTSADIALVQEPRFGTLIPGREDTDPDGVRILGAGIHLLWDCYTPPRQGEECCLVATYVRRSFASSPDIIIIPQPDHPGSSLFSQFLDILVSGSLFCIANIYNQVTAGTTGRGKRHTLLPLFMNPLPSFIPTLIAGDFNTHSSTWSFPGATVSKWAGSLEDWFEDSDLVLASPPQVATCRGEATKRGGVQADSVLDLLLLNGAASDSGLFSPVSVSFSDSLGLDHSAPFISWFPPTVPRPYKRLILPGFVLQDSLHDTWTKAFPLLPTPPMDSVPLLTAAADRLDLDIYDTCTPLFKRRMTPDFRGVRWWNIHCEAALTMVVSAPKGSHASASCDLRRTIHAAKRAWSNEEFHHTLPDKAWCTAWCHGRKANRIPPILKVDGTLATSSTDIRTVFSDRFFPTIPKLIPPSHPDDPAPKAPCSFAPITPDEVSHTLSDTSNRLAPGPSGIGYKLLKWTHAANPERLTSLYNAAISLSTHPWKAATVLPVPKPNKPDYRLAKAYRPISLLECCGKLLEKIVARCVLEDAGHFHLLPPSQFSSRDYHCATDACLSLVHSAQSCVKTGHVAALLLFDIQGLFDNLYVDCLVFLFANLGFDPTLCGWVRSFLTARRVSLSFNGDLLPEVSLNHGTPQGSPLSPIISAIYTIPLLRISEAWRHKALALYVDDGSILATGATHDLAMTKAADGFCDVISWLNRNGLTIDSNKTEYISFYPKRANPNHIGLPFQGIKLSVPGSGVLEVHRSKTVHYLGVFLNEFFSWEPHAKVMANRARSTMRALHVMGNSVRSLDFANWRKVFHAIILPVLTYSLALWLQSPPKSLLHIFQVAQNDGVCHISGTFCTTPVDPLHNMVAILPCNLKPDHF